MSSIHDTIWQAAVDEIAKELATDLAFIRALRYDWIYMREHSSELISLCYGYVRYSRDVETERESFVVFADRQDDDGPLQHRYLAGFQLGDDAAVYPLLTEALAKLYSNGTGREDHGRC